MTLDETVLAEAREVRQRLVDLECADDEEGKIGGVGEPVAIDRHHGGAIQFGNAFGGERLGGVVIRGVHLRQLFAEEDTRTALAVDERRVELSLQQRKGFGVVARLRETQVQKLQRRLEVCRRARTRDAMARKRDRGARGRELPRQQLVEERYQKFRRMGSFFEDISS